MPTERRLSHPLPLLLLLWTCAAAGPAARPDGLHEPFPPAGDAGRVVFVCHGAGRKLGEGTHLVPEVQRAIASLGPRQSFNVIFYRDGFAAPLTDQDLWPADDAHKAKAIAFAGRVEFKGTPDPVGALRLAFAQRPQVVYLLTDGRIAPRAGVSDALDGLNAGRRVVVHVAALLSPEDQNQPKPWFGVGAEKRDLTPLEQLAREHGGQFRAVDVTEWASPIVPVVRLDKEGKPLPTATAGPADLVGVDKQLARKVAFVPVIRRDARSPVAAAVKRDLSMALLGTKPIQSFAVVLPGEKAPQVFPPAGDLVSANAQNKRDALAFLDAAAVGAAFDPLPAVTAAIDLKPQLVYLLSDGGLPDADAFADTVIRRAAARRVRVNTVLLVSKDDEPADATARALERIAAACDGTFKRVTTDELAK